jgi:hypothetical protein
MEHGYLQAAMGRGVVTGSTEMAESQGRLLWACDPTTVLVNQGRGTIGIHQQRGSARGCLGWFKYAARAVIVRHGSRSPGYN